MTWNDVALYTPLVVFASLLFTLLYIKWSGMLIKREKPMERPSQHPDPLLSGLARMRMATLPRSLGEVTHESHETEAVEGEDEPEDLNPEGPVKKLGKKKLEKLARKQEQRELKEWMQIQREDRLQREAAEEEERERMKEQERVSEMKEKEEERQRNVALAHEEEIIYQQWKESIQLESQGTSGMDENEQQAYLEKIRTTLMAYLVQNKVVALEELVSEFHMKTKDLIEQLHYLEHQGRLLGFIDPYGRYISLLPQEMTSLAREILRRGHISKVELAHLIPHHLQITRRSSSSIPTPRPD